MTSWGIISQHTVYVGTTMVESVVEQGFLPTGGVIFRVLTKTEGRPVHVEVIHEPAPPPPVPDPAFGVVTPAQKEALEGAFWELVNGDASHKERGDAAKKLSKAFDRFDLDDDLREALEEAKGLDKKLETPNQESSDLEPF